MYLHLFSAQKGLNPQRDRSDEGLTLLTSAFESLYGGQFTLSTQLIKSNYFIILPPTQHHIFSRHLPPLIDFAIFVHRIKLIEDETHFLIYCNQYSTLRNKFYEKIEHIIPTFRQLSSLQAINELTTSSNHYINIQLTKYISSCFDLRNILLSNQTNVT